MSFGVDERRFRTDHSAVGALNFHKDPLNLPGRGTASPWWLSQHRNTNTPVPDNLCAIDLKRSGYGWTSTRGIGGHIATYAWQPIADDLTVWDLCMGHSDKAGDT